MHYLQGQQYFFVGSFGISKTGKTVTVSIIDNTGANKATGHTIGSVIELGSGQYGVPITFSESFNGAVRFNNTTDSLSVFVPISILADTAALVILARKMITNRWLVASNQMKFYDDDDSTVVRTMDLKKLGAANDGSDADERITA